MDKFNNSNSLALQKFYNQNNNASFLFELQQRLKTEQIVCEIEMKKLINEEKVEEKIEEKIEEQVINEKKVIEESNQEEPLSGESLGEIYYRSNENFEIDKPVILLERTKSTINQTKINNLIKLKKW